MKNIIYKRIFKFDHSQSGSVAVVVALSMIVLLAMFAFVIDTGYLYGEKNQYQNGVEAAAMAGAVSLCDEDSEGVARQVAIDNGLPADSITVQVGFYDEKDIYMDFPVYGDFVEEGEAGYPAEEFNNAVMVKLNATEESLMGGFVGNDEVTVGAAAVAYVIPYGLLSLGEEDDMGIKSNKKWEDAHPPELIDMGMIHANNEINFIKPPVLTGSNRVTAVNSISNCFEGVSGTKNENVSIPPIDWEGLRTDAENSGLVITRNDFPATQSYNNYNEYREDSYGNRFYYMDKGYIIGLHDGDYGGVVYYISEENGKFGDSNTIKIRGIGKTYATNFTITSEPAFMFDSPGGGYLYLGGENDDTVRIYCKNDIGSADNGFSQKMRGVLFRTEKDFNICSRSMLSSSSDLNQYMRIIAEESINFHGYHYDAALIVHGKFGPPCQPFRVFLGEL